MAKNHIVKLGFFKGPQIQLHSKSRIQQYGNDKYPFQFGVDKARMILDCIEEIKAFVASNGQTVGPVSAQTSTASNGGHGPDVDRLYEDQCARECGF